MRLLDADRVAVDPWVAVHPGRRVGPEDVAHSACRTFLRRIHGGEFELSGRDKLWNLLCAITLAKARKKARFHLADKRDVDHETRPTASQVERGDDPAAGIAAPAPTPEDAAAFADQFEHVMSAMDDEIIEHEAVHVTKIADVLREFGPWWAAGVMSRAM